jgi:signal transduction histidine kinase
VDAQHGAVLAADLVVGVVLLLGGVLLGRRDRVPGVLLTAAGASWLLALVWPLALFWHRGPLVHLLLASPGWRPPTVPAAAVTIATYVVSVLTPALWLDDRATLALGASLLAAAAWNLRGTSGVAKRYRRQAWWASLVLGSALLLGGVLGLVSASWWPVALAAYDTALVAVVVLLLVWSAPARVARLRELVIDLGDSREHPGSLALARALRDPDLTVAVWDPGRSAYLTVDGEPVPSTTPGRSTTRVDRDGRPSVLLVHDEALQDDPRLHEALEAAARLEAVNTTWQGEVAAHAQRVAESRRRLLAASDDERRRLEAELARGVAARLDHLAAVVGGLPGPPGSHVERALQHLVRTRQELDELAAGLRPRALAGGLATAVRDLAESVQVDARVTYDAGSLPGDVELTAYYVCAEALVNAAKHAPGARVALDLVSRDGRLVVSVVDDGPGGARLTDRGGLLGLRDRVEALGGRLDVESGPAGTRLVAELPLDHQS